MRSFVASLVEFISGLFCLGAETEKRRAAIAAQLLSGCRKAARCVRGWFCRSVVSGCTAECMRRNAAAGRVGPPTLSRRPVAFARSRGDRLFWIPREFDDRQPPRAATTARGGEARCSQACARACPRVYGPACKRDDWHS